MKIILFLGLFLGGVVRAGRGSLPCVSTSDARVRVAYLDGSNACPPGFRTVS